MKENAVHNAFTDPRPLDLETEMKHIVKRTETYMPQIDSFFNLCFQRICAQDFSFNFSSLDH